MLFSLYVIDMCKNQVVFFLGLDPKPAKKRYFTIIGHKGNEKLTMMNSMELFHLN